MRLMLAGTGSGCGKTTVTLALLRALKDKGITVQAFKSGPDYIDTGYHARTTGRPSHNLDPYMMGETAIKQVLSYGMDGAACGVIEGAMGYYDGIGPKGACSAYELAKSTETPAALIIDAKGSASSAAAVALGFREYVRESNIEGFFLNNISSRRHYELVRDAIYTRTGLPCIGYLPKNAVPAWPSRHLGLIQANEQINFDTHLDALSQAIYLEEDALFSLMRKSNKLEVLPLSVTTILEPFRMGIARDEAFTFYYEANFHMLEVMGMELVFFSPLHDSSLPDGLDGLYLGGGYPEIYKQELSRNTGMLHSLYAALNNGLRCYAECGGMMLLGTDIDGIPMTGFLNVSFSMTDRLQRFGYVTVEDKRMGISYRAHEFHHSIEKELNECAHALTIRKESTDTAYTGGYRRNNVLAAYPHVHFWGNEALVKALWSLQ